jgi:serine/threonine-protein kinase
VPILTEQERIGTALAGKYRIRSVLARGGMGVLFAGEHSWTGRPVAIKLLHPQYAVDAAAVQRFLREGRAATALRHAHVVDVLDMGQAEDGALYMVLELLDGVDLADLLDARGRLAPADVIAILTPVIDALASAHGKGFVHRDIKPSNVYLARQADGRVAPKLLDFGIAKAVGDTGASTATRTGVIVGTPNYMSPEQARGTGEIGPASDAWAMAVVLFQCISGVLPYDGPSPTAILMAVIQGDRKKLSDVVPEVPPAVLELVEQGLSMDPAQRPRDLRAWSNALRAAVGMPPLPLQLSGPELLPASAIADVARPVPEPSGQVALATLQQGPPERVRRRRLALLGAGAGAIGLAIAGLVVVLMTSSADAHPQPPPAPAAFVPPPIALPAVAIPTVAATPADAGPAPGALATTPPPAEAEAVRSATARPRPRIRRPRGEGTTRPTKTGARPIAEIDPEW